MARYSAGITTAAGSTTLPIISLYGIAAVNGRIVEIGVTNTTTTSVGLKIVRLSMRVRLRPSQRFYGTT